MRVLVLGASGFIGAHVAAALHQAGVQVRAGARRPEAARRLSPGLDWVDADFAGLTTPEDWDRLLDGVDAVVNCVGVLQDGGGDSTRLAHVDGPQALIGAFEARGVRRLIHISAVGADADAGTAYATSKCATEAMIEASDLDWAILRPSLVLGRAVYGGSAMMRGLAAFPGLIPVVGGEQVFRPVMAGDVAAAVVRLVDRGAPARVKLDLAGPEAIALADLLKRLRDWLGLSPAPVLRCPRRLAWPVLKAGDLLGRLGWSSPLRTTSLRQMDHDVAGDPAAWTVALGMHPTRLDDFLSANPADVQDRWHARLYFVRPLAIGLLGLYWILSGLVALGPGRAEAAAWLVRGGFGAWSGAASDGAAVLDLLLGLGLFVRSWSSIAAMLMALVSISYLIAGTLVLPGLWADPLGPWAKILPVIPLCLFVAATEARR